MTQEAADSLVGDDLRGTSVEEFLEYAAAWPPYVRDVAGGIEHPTLPGVMLIPLFRSEKFALIDAEDYPLVMRYRWREQTGYACASAQNGTRKLKVSMHRLVLMLLGDGKEVDHKNRARLDNRKANLRLCEHFENCWNLPIPSTNTSGIKGVGFWRGRWFGGVTCRGKTHRKWFDQKDAAADWVAETRAALHGSFASDGKELDEGLDYFSAQGALAAYRLGKA